MAAPHAMLENGPTTEVTDVVPRGAVDLVLQTFAIVFRRPAKLGTVFLMLLSPLVLVKAIVSIEQTVADTVIFVIASLLFFLASYLPGIGATLIVSDVYTGERTSVARIWELTWRDAIDVIVLGVAVTLACALGFVLLIVPGVLLIVGWAVAAPALVVERLTPSEALARSWALTHGNRRRVLGALVLLWIATGLPAWGIGALFGEHTAGGFLVDSVLTIATSMVLGVFVAVCYIDLRAREGLDADRLAEEIERVKVVRPAAGPE